MKRLLLTHNDLDGLGCQLMLESAFGDVTSVPINYGEIDEWLDVMAEEHDMLFSYDEIYITDVFIREQKGIDILNQLAANGTKIFIFDHHETSEPHQKLVNYTAAKFGEGNGDESSTLRTYQFLYPNGDGPKGVAEEINKYDVHYDRESDGFAFNKLYWHKGRAWAHKQLSGHNEFVFTDEAKEAMVDYKEKAALARGRVAESARHEVIGEKKIALIRARKYMDDVLLEFNDKDLIVVIKGNRVSFRHGEESAKDLHMDKIAELFDGGGHPYAAGGSIPFMKGADEYIFNILQQNGELFK